MPTERPPLKDRGPPHAIDRLSPALSVQHSAIWQCVSEKSHILRIERSPLDILLRMNNIVVDNTWDKASTIHAKTIQPGSVCVENNSAAPQVAMAHRIPVRLFDRAAAGCGKRRRPRPCFEEDQRPRRGSSVRRHNPRICGSKAVFQPRSC